MENFVRRLFSDAEFRRAFLANPTEIVTNSGLAQNERDAALRLSGHMAATVTAPRAGVLSLEGLVWN